MIKCPTHFYKYLSLSNGSAKFVERIICNDELYFSRPSSFNDPFDCRPSFLFDTADDDIIKYYATALARHAPHLTQEQRFEEAKAMLANPSRDPRRPEVISEISRLHTEMVTEHIGVLCLSEVRDDILMWSHYANSHRGICLEFDGYFELFAKAQEVVYPPVRPQTNPWRQSRDEIVDTTLLSKSAHWAYEHEWRCIEYNQGYGIYNFPPEALTGLILGAHILPDDKKMLHYWLSSRPCPIRLYRSTPCKTTFALIIDEVPLDYLHDSDNFG